MKKRKNLTPNEKIAAVLGGRSIYDICKLGGFRSNLEAYVKVQREDRQVVREQEAKLGGGKYHAPAHAIDKTLDWSLDEWEEQAIKVFYKASDLPKSVRDYVYQLGKQAYNVTCANLVINQFPEMRRYFFGTSKVV